MPLSSLEDKRIPVTPVTDERLVLGFGPLLHVAALANAEVTSISTPQLPAFY
jgi:hypothetical protein